MSESPHIAILGAGPGGYVAAIRAAQLGARVTVIEAQALGGVCLNWGCIPSKALLSVVELGDKLKKAAEMGISIQGPVTYDLAQMVTRKNKVVANLVKGIGTLFQSWGITHLKGTGVLTSSNTLRVTRTDGVEETVEANAIVIATGSSWPDRPLAPGFPIDGIRILTSKQALDLIAPPASLLIVGGGVEGCEFASLFSALGTQVTMVEMLPQILSQEDDDMATFVDRELRKRGVIIHTDTSVDAVHEQGAQLAIMLKSGAELRVDHVLVSVGRRLNSRGLGLEAVGVKTGQRGEILVDDTMQTNVPEVYAIGDVVGKAMLAHVASAQGKVAVENILGHHQAIRYEVIPSGIFTLPEIGRVGLTERQAREACAQRGGDPETGVAVGRFRYAGLGKAQATGEVLGLFKVITERSTDKILGVHIVGPHAADLIHEAALAIELGGTAKELAGMIHAHPTLAEGLMEAAEDVSGMAIHLARRRN
jgi:dihydrolipoamide dehydrogenase